MRQITKRAVRGFSLLILAVALAYMLTATNVLAATIFESGTLGPTGVPWGDVANQTVLGASISSNIFNGVRFQLAQPAVATLIGGHFVGTPDGPNAFFGAVVALDNESDFPDSGDLSTPDVLGTTEIAFPEPSAEVFGNLDLSLDAGWYALVFGSGLFGVVGDGAMPLNNPDIGHPTYIGFQPGPGLGWGNLINPIFRNYHFVVQGRVVPEPATVGLMSIVLLSVSFIRTPRRQYPSHSARSSFV